jgi:hypothetical protein
MTAIDDWIAEFAASKYSDNPENLRTTVNTAILALQALQAGLAPAGVQLANTFLGGPASGAAALAAYRLLVAADLPLPQAAAIGGVRSLAAVANQFLTGIVALDGSVTRAQPAFSDLSGYPVLTALANSIAGNVAMNNAALFFTGPTVAQGALGTWLATGQVTVTDTVAASFICKLWDGATVIDSALCSPTVGNISVVSLSGVLATPAGNLRISVKDSAATGTILANTSGEGKDSTLTVVRIA